MPPEPDSRLATASTNLGATRASPRGSKIAVACGTMSPQFSTARARLRSRFQELLLLSLVLAMLPLSACAPPEGSASAPGSVGSKGDGVAEVGAFFSPGSSYYVRVDGWPADRMTPADLEEALAFPGTELRVYRSRPDATEHCPDSEVTPDDLVYSTSHFSMRTSGNLTNGTPKSSFKLKALRYRCDENGTENPEGTERCRDTLADMRALNLKSMWNDVSQMREALAWGTFAAAGVHAPQHTYARFCINDRYYGLYSVIEQVDGDFIDRHFGANDDGNLYKAYWSDIGPADLTRRGDRGSDYFTAPVVAEALPVEMRDGSYGASRSQCVAGSPTAGTTSVDLDVTDFGAIYEVEVSVALRHEDLDDLRIVVEQDGVEAAVLWECEGASGEARSARAEDGGLLRLTRDLATRISASGGRPTANGRWTLRVEDHREGRTGAIVDFRIQRHRTYRLQTNDDPDDADEVPAQGYDDLARFIDVINASNPEGEDYRDRVEDVFDVYTFLRWASTNVLLGAWDNYWATPANYYLYNSGRRGRDGDLRGKDAFVEHPYFHFVPWDYDNSFGNDYFDVNWHEADIVDIEAATAGYYDSGRVSELPLLTQILKNPDFLRYYLGHIEHLLDHVLNEDAIRARIGDEREDRRGGLWDLVRDSAFLESESGTGAPHTGRQFTNDQVYWNGYRGYDLRIGDFHAIGILRDPDGAGGYVHLREQSARQDLAELRARVRPSGAGFPAPVPAELPHIRDRLR